MPCRVWNGWAERSNRRDDEYEALEGACDEFFAANGVNPDRPGRTYDRESIDTDRHALSISIVFVVSVLRQQKESGVTQPEHRDYLSTEQVAAELGVSPMRVRQLANSGELPTPAKLGERVYMWHFADIAAVKARRADQPSTQASGLLETPEHPLGRVVEEIVDIPLNLDGTAPMHVRIWTGAAPEGQRTVVLLGQLTGHFPVVQARLEESVQTITPLLPVEPRAAVWFSYTPGNEGSPQDVGNLIWHPEDVDDPASPLSRLLRRAAKRGTQHGKWPRLRRPSSLPEVERVVGGPVEAYPAPAYTPDTIESWRRTGHTVPVPRYQDDHESLMGAARTLADVQADAPSTRHAATADAAVHLLVDEVRELHRAIDDLPWDDGTRPPFGREPGPEWPATWAAHLVKPRIADADQRLLDAHPDPFAIPKKLDELDTLRELLPNLRSWSREVDPYSDTPNERLHQSLERAAQLAAFYLRVNDPEFRKTDHPDSSPRISAVVGPWDRAYLAQLEEVDVTRHSRSHRILFEQLHRQISGEKWLRWGTDPDGRLVAHYPGDPHDRPELYAVEWPLNPPTEPIPAGTRIVADGEHGDRPAYLAYPDGHITPLPADPRFPDGWNFGYGGSGPGALEMAIVSTFSRADNIDADAMPRRWIDDQVEHADHARPLEIAVDELRRRYPS